MFKGALLAVTVVAASTAMAVGIDLDPGPAPASAVTCDSASATDAGCTLRVLDPGDDSVFSSSDLANLAPAAPAFEWPPLHPSRSTGLDFKDAASDPGSMPHAALGRDTSHPLIPALLALGALVVLLRRRPL